MTEQSILEQPVIEQSMTEQSVAEQPVTEQPTTEQPVTEQSVTEQPVTEQSMTAATHRAILPNNQHEAAAAALAVGSAVFAQSKQASGVRIFVRPPEIGNLSVSIYMCLRVTYLLSSASSLKLRG